MQKLKTGQMLYSATDLVHFLECEHLTNLDMCNLETPLPKAVDDEQAALIKNKGYAHESAYARRLCEHSGSFIDIAACSGKQEERHAATEKAMREGVHIIYQATFLQPPFIGYADFLRRVEVPSRLGNFSYEVLDTKLARSPQAKFVIQLTFYSAMLAAIQGLSPESMHVVLGDGSEASFRVADYAHYLERVKSRFLARVTGQDPAQTYPTPCEHCDLCRWRDLCEEKRVADDHLSLVANILKIHVRRLNDAGINTLAALAGLAPGVAVPRMPAPVLERLRHQARLQFKARTSGKQFVELIEADPASVSSGGLRGFARMPKPATGDLFFDMEGDPFEVDGLEYLFGLYYFNGETPVFKPFWAHNRAEERRAFEDFMDFVIDHLERYPGAHIYHYASYEETALKKLMGLHGTREAAVDKLLREHRLVDLYRVVREAIRVSEPKYSIKNIEHFYRKARTGSVQNAGASVVAYEKWKDTRDPQILQAIADYNRDDVESTHELRQWLLQLRPAALFWADYRAPAESGTATKSSAMAAMEQRLAQYREKLIAGLPADTSVWTADHRRLELTWHLLDFQRRMAKPQWWALFDRQKATPDERHEDPECIAGLCESLHPAKPEGRSLRHTFRLPEQDIKLKIGRAHV